VAELEKKQASAVVLNCIPRCGKQWCTEVGRRMEQLCGDHYRTGISCEHCVSNYRHKIKQGITETSGCSIDQEADQQFCYGSVPKSKAVLPNPFPIAPRRPVFTPLSEINTGMQQERKLEHAWQHAILQWKKQTLCVKNLLFVCDWAKSVAECRQCIQNGAIKNCTPEEKAKYCENFHSGEYQASTVSPTTTPTLSPTAFGREVRCSIIGYYFKNSPRSVLEDVRGWNSVA
jgi:hypothetical protein